MSVYRSIFFHKILPFSCHLSYRFQKTLKQNLALGAVLFSITPLYSAEWAVTAVGSLFSGPATRMVSNAYNATSTFIVEQMTIPKADENTLYIHVNSVDIDKIRQLCTDKISFYNLEIFKLKENHKHNLEAINFDLGNKQELINQWVKNYIFISYTVQKVLDFREIYTQTYGYIDILKDESSKGRSSLSVDSKIKLDQQYDSHLSYLRERLLKIGALLKAQFPYEGQGGVLDRSKSSADRKKNRKKLWGVSNFGPTDHQKKLDKRDENILSPVSELDKKLNTFRDFYRQTEDVISQPIDTIINSIYPDGIILEAIYSQLGLTEQGLKPLPILSSSPLAISPLHNKSLPNSLYRSSPSNAPSESSSFTLNSPLRDEEVETNGEDEVETNGEDEVETDDEDEVETQQEKGD